MQSKELRLVKVVNKEHLVICSWTSLRLLKFFVRSYILCKMKKSFCVLQQVGVDDGV